MSTETPTPRTDAAVAKSGFMGEEKVTADYARQLERELAESNADRMRLREALEKEAEHCPGCHGDGESRAHSIPAPCPRCRDSRAALNSPPPPVVAPALAESLAGQLLNMFIQHGCTCGHPSCKKCRDTKEAKEAWETYRAKHPAPSVPSAP